MKKFWTKSVLAAALMCAGAAHADLVDFENVDTTLAPFAPLLAGGDVLFQGNYFVNTQDANGVIGSQIGQLSNGTDPTSCLNGVCPAGNSTNFLSVYNDGVVHFGRWDGVATVFDSLSAAFLATPGFAGSAYLALEADRADGTYAVYAYALNTNGTFKTITASTPGGILLGGSGALDSRDVTHLFAYSYYCPSGGGCSAFTSDKGQFALDDITMDVPEPAALALVIGALGALGASRKIARRRSV